MKQLLWAMVACFFSISAFAQEAYRESFNKNGKWGYKNENGKTVIKAQYQEAAIFFHGYALIKKNNKYGIISQRGREFVKPSYDSLIYLSSLNSSIATKKDLFVGVMNGKTGILQVTANTYSDTFYSEIKVSLEYDKFEALNTHPSTFLVAKNDKYGLISADGKELVSLKYDSIIESPEKSSYIINLDGKYGLISKMGAELISPRYDTIEWIEYGDTKLGVYLATVDGKHGIVTRTGTELISPQYDAIEWVEIGDKKIGVYITKSNGKYGLISFTGKTLFAPEFLAINKEYLQSVTPQTTIAFGEIYFIDVNDKDDISNPIKITKLSDYKSEHDNPWDAQYLSLLRVCGHYNRVISPQEFKRIDDKFEEEIDGNIYTHYQGYKSVSCNGTTWSFIKNCIDQQYYIYITNKEKNEIYKKIAGLDLVEFAKIGDAHRFHLKSLGVLSNGDYLLEMTNTIVDGYYNYMIAPPTFIVIQGQLMCVDSGERTHFDTTDMRYVAVIDGKDFTFKHALLLDANSKILGVSNNGGWYIGSLHNGQIADQYFPISKFSNDCKLLWSYTPDDGVFFKDLYETEYSLYLGGATTKLGYIGRDNPYICRLDASSGKKESDKLYKIGNTNYAVCEFAVGWYNSKEYSLEYEPLYRAEPLAFIGHREFRGYQIYPDKFYKDSFKKEVPFMDMESDGEVSIVRAYHEGVYAYGLINSPSPYWVVPPVVPGEDPIEYGEYVIYPTEAYYDDVWNRATTTRSTVVKHNSKYGRYIVEEDGYSGWLLPCIYDSYEEVANIDSPYRIKSNTKGEYITLVKLSTDGTCKYGWIKLGDENSLVAPIYESKYSMDDNGLTAVRLHGKWGWVDAKGKTVIPFEYDDSQFGDSYYYFSEEFPLCLVWKDGKIGMINNKGEEIVPIIYEDTSMLENGTQVFTQDNRNYYYDTRSGKLLKTEEKETVE